MKKVLRHSLLLLASVSLLFTACQKNVSTDTANTENEEIRLKDEAQKDIDNHKALIAAFQKENASNLRTTARTNGQPNIVEFATSFPFFKSLVAAVVKTGLAPTLSAAEVNLTVFAPTDAAFAQLPAPFNNPTNINSISDPAQIEALKNILLYHVLGTEVKAHQIADGRSSAQTLKPATGNRNNNTIYFSKQFGLLAINGNRLALLTDLDASNGVVHVINGVLLPPSQTIAEVATTTPGFSALVAGLVKTNLVGVFTGSGNFTVFAPTDAAFAQLPAPFNTAANISAISNPAQIDALANILKYHVTSTRYFTLDLGFLQPIQTLAAEPNNRVIGVLGIESGFVKGNKNLTFSGAFPANILATNGVVHVINQVLQP